MRRHGKPHDDGNKHVQDVNVVLRLDLAKTFDNPRSIDVNFFLLVPPEDSSLSTRASERIREAQATARI